MQEKRVFSLICLCQQKITYMSKTMIKNANTKNCRIKCSKTWHVKTATVPVIEAALCMIKE